MPVQFGQDASGCYARWGEAGKAYYYECSNESAKADAESQAQTQGAAIEANATQADTNVEGAMELTVEPTADEPTPPKHIKVRLNNPAHFSAYQTIPYHRTPDGKEDAESDGVQVSYGIWKTTGAKTAQVYLFDREKGWDDAKVEAWFAARPQIPRPVSAPVVATQAVNDALLDIPATLAASTSDANVWQVHVIREGFGKNRRLGTDGRYYQDYFPKSFLQQLVPMLEGSAVQAIKISKDEAGDLPGRVEDAIAELKRHGHPDTMTNVLLDQGLIGNTIGFFRQAEFAENAVADEAGTPRAVDKAQLVFATTPAAEHTRQLVKFAWDKGFKQSLGLSINYRANASFQEVEGRPAFVFEKPTHYVSCEIVPNAAAHGGIISVIQSMQELNEKDDIQGGAAASATPEQPQQQAAPEQHDVPAAQAVEPKVVEKIVEKVIVDESAKAELDALKAQFAAFTQAQQEKEAKHALEIMVTQSELDADSKQVLLSKVVDGSIPTEAMLKNMIDVAQKARQYAIAATQAQQPAMGFPGMSAKIEMGKSPADVAAIRSKLLWDVALTQSEEDLRKKYGITRYHGIQDEYKAVTGDHDMRFSGLDMNYFRQMVGAFAQSTSMTTDTYPEFLKNVISLRVERHWQGIDKNHLKVVKVGEPFSDTRPEDEYILGKMSDISSVSEDGGYTEVSAPYKEKVTSNAVKYGNILSFSEETILNDNVDLIKQTADIFTEAMNSTMAGQIWKMLCNYSSAFNDKNVGTSASGGVLYDSSLNNTITGNAYDIDKVRDLVDLMMTQTDIAPNGETGQPLILLPYLAVCNVKNTGTVEKILNGGYEITSTNVGDALSLGIPADRIVGVHPNYLYSKPSAMFLLPNPAIFAGMELRYFRGQSAPSLVYEGSQLPNAGYAFSHDRMLLKIKMRWRLTLKRKKAFFALYPAD